MLNPRFHRLAPILVVLLVALLTVLSVGASLIVARHFTNDAIATSRIYSRVYEGLLSGREGAEVEALFNLSEMVTNTGIPLIVTDGMGNVTAAENLPFEATLEDPQTFSEPWTIEMPLYRLVEDNAQILEHKCVPFADKLLYWDLWGLDDPGQ